MAKSRNPNTKSTDPAVGVEGPNKSVPKNIFALANRGMLLDIVVFLANVLLMRSLTKRFVDLYHQVSVGDQTAEITMFLFCISIFVLPALGAVLKRWPFHERLQAEGRVLKKQEFAIGCLFNPILYFSFNLVLFVFIYSFFTQYKNSDQPESTTAILVMLGLGFTLPTIQTVLVYKYLSPPKKDPPIAFLRSRTSELFGDVFVYVNMILFQVVWNWLLFSFMGFPRVTGVYELFTRLLFLIVLALFIYLPPRIFYLAEDITRRRVWLTMLLANLPVIYHVVIGAKDAGW